MNIYSIDNSKIDLSKVTQSMKNGIKDINDKNETQEKFSSYLHDAIREVDNFQVQSKKIESMVNINKKVNLSDIIAQSHQTTVTLQAFFQLRNYFIESYKEIMGMPV